MSAFTRELIESVISGDSKITGAFLQRLITKMGEQMALDFTQQAALQAGKQAKAAKRRAKG